MNSGDIALLKQLIESLEETLLKLEEAKQKKDLLLFNNSKKTIINLQAKIGEILR